MAVSKMGVLALVLVAFAAATNAAHIDTYRAYLKGKNQVPSVRSPAWGWMYIQVDNEMMMINMTLSVTGIHGMVAAHIHNGTKGTNGPVVVPLYSSTDGLPEGVASSLSSEDEIVMMYSMPVASAPELPAFLMSGMAYVNVHTMMYPGGELRGQVNYQAPMVVPTIASVMGMYPELSMLLAAVSTDEVLLGAALDPNSAFTVLAPTNAAFEAILAELNVTVDDLAGNEDMLRTVLSYHILPQVILAKDVPMSPGADVPTLMGATVKAEMTMDGMVMINGVATVTMPDIMAGMSVIHMIDTVLLPPMK